MEGATTYIRQWLAVDMHAVLNQPRHLNVEQQSTIGIPSWRCLTHRDSICDFGGLQDTADAGPPDGSSALGLQAVCSTLRNCSARACVALSGRWDR